MRFVIDRKLSLSKILQKAGYDLYLNSNCFCPFHEDHNHRSAKLYQDDDGEHIFCFAERKMFGASDALLLLNLPLEKIFTQLWARLSEEEKSQMTLLSHDTTQFLSPEWLEQKARIKAQFSTHKITFSKLLEELEVVFNYGS